MIRRWRMRGEGIFICLLKSTRTLFLKWNCYCSSCLCSAFLPSTQTKLMGEGHIQDLYHRLLNHPEHIDMVFNTSGPGHAFVYASAALLTVSGLFRAHHYFTEKYELSSGSTGPFYKGRWRTEKKTVNIRAYDVLLQRVKGYQAPTAK